MNQLLMESPLNIVDPIGNQMLCREKSFIGYIFTLLLQQLNEGARTIRRS